jgi:hypothetical protein
MTNNTVSQTLERINRDTQWDSLTQDQVSSVLIRMEDATVNFYESETWNWNRKEHRAIQEFWDREWGCTYKWKKREWRYTASGKRFESEGEKRAKRVWEERIDDEEQEQQEQDQQDQSSWSGVDWLSAYDSYHDYGWYDKMTEQKQVTTATAATTTATTTATRCQTVLYIEELPNDSGTPDWRMFIHYNHNSNRYIINGTRGNEHAGGLRGVLAAPLPEIRLAFQYRSDVLDYLAWCMNTRPACNMAMYAMCCESVATLRVDELLSSRSKKTELYGYDNIRIRTADLREQLAVLRGLDSNYSNFDDITLV